MTHLPVRPLLSLALVSIAIATLSAVPTTITFTTDDSTAWADGIATDGDGGSTNLPSRNIQVYLISDVAGTQAPAAPLSYSYDLDSFRAIAGYSSPGDGRLKGMAIRSHDGSEFQLNGFFYSNWGAGSPLSLSVIGYRNGAQVASAGFTTAIDSVSFQSATVTLDSTFDNIDEVRVFSATDSWHGLNDIVIDDPAAAPTVTDARISIFGASGTGGAFRIGDTVTATWNNTAGGDNNAGISGVTMNLSQFGGGSAVVATNSGGTWTATYMITAGVIDAINRNVSVTATGPGGPTTTADTTNATVDNIRPSVTSITVNGSPAASATSMSFTANFNQSVFNVSTDDFTLVATGSATGTITSVSAASGSSMAVNIASIDGAGSLRVNLNGSTNVTDDAGNGIGAFTSGSTHTVMMPTTPGAPTIGTATAGDGQVSVTFTSPVSNGGSAITTYTATANPGGAFGTCAGPAACTATVAGLTNGTAYTFTVTATNAVGTSVASGASNSATPKANQTITFTDPGAQNFGTSPALSGTATSGLTVTFSSSSPGVCTVSSGGNLTFVTAGSCTIDADQAGNNAWNAATTVTRTFTVNAIVPGAPTIGTATAGDTQASVTFTAPASTGGASITGYTVTANPGGATGTGAVSPITVAGLTNGVAYTFTVAATNNAGTGSSSTASNAITPAAPQTITFNTPGTQNFGTTPTLTATSSSALTVTFTSSTTGVCTITPSGGLTFVTAGSCTIVANQAGDGGYLPATPVSQTFTVSAVAPGAPTAVVATAGDTQASVAFTAPAFSGGATIVGYNVTANPGGSVSTGVGSPISVTGLTNGVDYTFTVTATTHVGTGAASAASNSITPAAPQTIMFFNPGAQHFGTTPTLSAKVDSNLTPVFTSSTPAVCTITSMGALTFVTAGTCTINADQPGNASYLPAAQVVHSFTVDAVLPGAPTVDVATAGDSTASVSFSAPDFTGGEALTGYTVTSSPGGLTATGAAAPLVVAGLTNGTAYTFTVTATNTAGTGPSSAPSNAVTPTPDLPAVSIAVAPASVSETGGTPLAFTVTRSQALGTATTVALTTSGTATSGADYTGAATSVTIPAGATTATVTIAPVADAIAESDETVTIDLVAGTGYTLGSPSSATGTITNDAPALLGPSHFRITAMAGNQVSLAWVLPTGEVTSTGILLEGGLTAGASDGVGQLLTLAPAATVTLPTGSYYLRLRLMTSDGLSAPSNEIHAHVNVAVAPSAPAFLLGAAEGTTVRLAWTPTFGGGAPTGAVVDVTGAVSASVPIGPGDTFSFNGVPSGTYTFAVRQTNAAGTSAPSAPVTLTFPSACSATPQTPLHLVAYSVAGRVLLQWDPPSAGPAPSGYTLMVGGAFTGSVPVSSRVFDTPAPAGVYQFAVAATNACGSSAPGALQTVEVRSLTPTPAPRAVGDSYTTPYGTALTVDAPGLFSNDVPNGSGAMVAELVAAPGNGTATVTTTGGFTYMPRAGFTGTDTFSYRVATLAGGPSAAAYVSIVVGAATGPRAPIAVADAYGTPVDTALTVAAPRGVLANDDALGGTALTALLETAPSHGALTLASDGSFTYTPAGGFAGSDSFSYRPATTSAGAGDAVTVAVTVAGVGRPLALTNFRILAISGNRVTFAWALPSSGPAPAGILIEGGTTPDSVVGVLAPLPATSAATVALPTGSFYIRARATTSTGLSDPSNEVLVHLNVPLVPSAPTGLLGDVSGSAVHLAWTPTFGGGAPTSARVDVTGATTLSIPVAAGDTFTYPGAPAGTYTFTVRQVNAAGLSAASPPVTLSVPASCGAAPQAPVGAVAAWIDGRLLVQWNAPKTGPAPTGYRVNVTGALNGTYATAERFLGWPVAAGSYTMAVVATNGCGTSTATTPQTVIVR